jgi:hypothetical protein
MSSAVFAFGVSGQPFDESFVLEAFIGTGHLQELLNLNLNIDFLSFARRIVVPYPRELGDTLKAQYHDPCDTCSHNEKKHRNSPSEDFEKFLRFGKKSGERKEQKAAGYNLSGKISEDEARVQFFNNCLNGLN